MKWYSKTYIGVFLAFLYLPIMILIVFSFNKSKGRTFTGFTTKWYSELFSDAAIMDALFTTLIVAFVAAIVATAMGTAAAMGMEKLDNRLKSVVMNLTYVPIINPEIITGVSFMLLFVTAKKWLGALGIEFEFGWATLILSHITFNIPYVILNVLPKLRQLDRTLIEAAMDLGCSPVQAFFKVTIHEIKPGIVAGFLMALTFSMDDFVVSYFTTGAEHQPLSVMVYAMTKRRVSPEINALSTVMFMVIMTVLVGVNLIERNKISKLKGQKKIVKIGQGNFKPTMPVILLAMVCLLAVGSGSAEVYGANPEPKKEPKYDMNYYGKFKSQKISINVYNWGEYISNGEDDTLDINYEFEKLTGIKVKYSNFETNEGMYAKLKSGANSYDVIFPSDYMVSRLIEEKMIQPIDFKNIPNMKYIGKEFLNPDYDPENLYSIPYMWGRVAIIYNGKAIGKEIDSIDELWNPSYAGRMLMFKNSRDAFALALEKLGYDLNTENKNELQEAAELLKQQKPLVQAYVMDQIFDKMQGNEAIIAPYYIGDYYIMKEVNPDLRAFIPEYTNIYFDAMCIPADSNHKEAAEMYINFLNEPEIAAANTEYIMYSTPNLAAKELLDDEIKNNKDLYPEPNELENTISFINLSEETNLYIDRLWTDILSEDSQYLDWVMPVFVVFSVSFLILNGIRKRKKRH